MSMSVQPRAGNPALGGARTPFQVRRLMVKSFSWVREMDAKLKGEEANSVAEILEKIRARLSEQIKSEVAAERGNSSQSIIGEGSTTRLRVLLDAMCTLQGQVGAVNPRPTGLGNDLIQFFKKALRRALGWYIRPTVQYQQATLQLLGEVIKVLECDQRRMQTLEARAGLLLGELTDLRQQTLAKLERLADELAKQETERL